MKKIICIILIICLMSCILCGCGKDKGNMIYNQFVIVSETFDIWNGNLYIVYDKDTNVMYYLVQTSYKFDLCPVYDTDGTIMIHKEE